MKRALSLAFGALADPLHKQVGVPKASMCLYQKLADAVTYLSIHQFLRESEKKRMRQRILNLVALDERPEFVAALGRVSPPSLQGENQK